LCAFLDSLGDIRGYHPSFDPYYAYLEDVPRKNMWSPFFDHTFDFSMAFDEFKRPVSLVASSFLEFSYSHNSEMHAITYDKRALTAFESRTELLSDMEEWLMLHEPHIHHLSEA